MLPDRQEAAGIDTGGARLGAKGVGSSLSVSGRRVGRWVDWVFFGRGKEKKGNKVGHGPVHDPFHSTSRFPPR